MSQKFIIPNLSAKSYYWWWPLLAILIVIIIAFLVFSALYIIPSTIHGLGILLVQGELSEVKSSSEAILESWLVEEGQALQKNQTVARIRSQSGPELIDILAPQNGLMAEIIRVSRDARAKR